MMIAQTGISQVQTIFPVRFDDAEGRVFADAELQYPSQKPCKYSI